MEHVQVPGLLLLLQVSWETGSRGLNRDSPVKLKLAKKLLQLGQSSLVYVWKCC